MRSWKLLAVTGALVLGLAAPASATAPAAAGARHLQQDYITVRGAAGSGPVADDAVHVLRVGSPTARQVLVLVPGQFGAAGDFGALARSLAERLPGTQIWAVDRREQDLADLSGFRAGSPDRAAAYYLGGRYRPTTAQSAPYVGDWGLALELADLRQVVRTAGDGGRRTVVLGGHSWGAATALAYAAWDFDGHPGYRDISGLVLIDGGVHDAFAGEGDTYRVTAQQATAQLAQIAAGEVFDPQATVDRTESLAIDTQLAAQYAVAAPDAPSTLAPLLPAVLRPTRPVTNQGLIDWLFVSHPLVADLSINPAHTRPQALARDYAGPAPAAMEWYWPERLTLDLSAADAYGDTPAARVLGLRLWHAGEIDVPLYSFESGLTHGTVNTAAQWVVSHSRIPTATYAGDDTMTHLDVVFADADRNPMLGTLVPFLREL
ncbi:alpha/beta hydrolase [Streptacidiphilus sp. EB129]|uniref:alpha/beta hydrolase n=1 Tax=Streptacidiphilus sp. EB129 TaxID=3156262 RepID=UPI00351831A6